MGSHSYSLTDRHLIMQSHASSTFTGMLLPPLLILLQLTTPFASPSVSPVILVPGLAGSVFTATTKDYKGPHSFCSGTVTKPFTLWVALTKLVPKEVDCTLDRLLLHFDATTGAYKNTAGVNLDTNVDFGGVGGVEYLDPDFKVSASAYFAPMIKHLTQATGGGGLYKVGKNLHGAPYDWRLGPDGHARPGQYYDKLAALIEHTYVANGNTSVTVVTHSLGGPTILGFLRRRTSKWLSQYVRAFMPISGPFGGTSTMALAMASGDNFGAPLVPGDYLRPVQATAASGVFLLPDATLYDAEGPSTIIETPTANYTARDWGRMMSDLGLNQTREIMTHISKVGMSAGQLFNQGWPGVPTFVVTSHGVKTRNHFLYKTPFSHDHVVQPDIVGYGEGDGVVDLQSLLWPEMSGQWKCNACPLQFFNVSGVEHFGMVSEPSVLKYLSTTVLGL